MSDPELAKQFVTVCACAAIVTVLEAVLFFRIVSPEVEHSLHGMLGSLAAGPPLPDDPVARDALRAALAAADARERVLVGQVNRAALFNAAAIAALPVLAAGAVLALHPGLRGASKWPIVADCAVIMAGIAAFEHVFYVMGHRWVYPADAEMTTTVTDAYRAGLPAGADASPVADCAACLEKLRAQADASPTRGSNNVNRHCVILEICVLPIHTIRTPGPRPPPKRSRSAPRSGRRGLRTDPPPCEPER